MLLCWVDGRHGGVTGGVGLVCLLVMSEKVAATPDQVPLGVLVSSVMLDAYCRSLGMRPLDETSTQGRLCF